MIFDTDFDHTIEAAMNAVVRLIAPLLWSANLQEYPCGVLQRFSGIAPDPLQIGYSKPFGLGLCPHRLMDTHHCAVFWAKGPTTHTPRAKKTGPLGFTAWYGAPQWGTSPNSAHQRLAYAQRDRVFTAQSAAFLDALNHDADVRALLAFHTNTRLAFLFPPPLSLGAARLSVSLAYDGAKGPCRRTISGGRGIPQPHRPLKAAA